MTLRGKNVLDLETSSISGTLADGFALEPWRARNGTAFIDSLHYLSHDRQREIMIKRPNRGQLIDFLKTIEGEEVWAHNAVFDVAWLIASLEKSKYAPVPDIVKNIRWRDSLLLSKWILNSQRADRAHYSYSLGNICSDALRDEPGVDEFVAFKSGVPIGPNSAYWEKRGMLDCIWTQKLVEKIWPRLEESQHCGFIIEQACIPFVANSWLMGLKVNVDKLRWLESELNRENAELQAMVDFNISMVSSPKQMQNYLFGVLGLKPQKFTATGASSTAVETLKLLHYELEAADDPRKDIMRMIMTLKNNATTMSKYVKTVWEALERTKDGYMYPIPQMFGTITGRFSYSNTTGYRGPKVSFAAHQIPRKEKRVRDYVEAPEGEFISEYDASGQESRIMTMWSQDPTMLDIFNHNKNFHSMTACNVIGEPYETFQAKIDREDPHATEIRQMGKLANLSCNYRIGGPALSRQSFVKYDMVIPIPVSYQLINTFNRVYREVPGYWRRAIDFARRTGYATTAADRRYKIDDWSKAWMAEQTAISNPIQGTGADHKLIAMATVCRKIPEARFSLDLHDASFFIVPNKECHDEVGHVLNTIKYADAWCNVNCNVPLPFEGKLGRSFKDVK